MLQRLFAWIIFILIVLFVYRILNRQSFATAFIAWPMSWHRVGRTLGNGSSRFDDILKETSWENECREIRVFGCVDGSAGELRAIVTYKIIPPFAP